MSQRQIAALALAVGFLSSATLAKQDDTVGVASGISQTPSVFVITNSQGVAVSLFSSEAYEAEFRYLRRVWHQIDLKSLPVQTDGWTYNVQEAEWPFLGFCYLGYAAANLAKADPTFRDEASKEMRWLVEALQTPRMSGFMTAHFGEPFGTNGIKAAVFVHGHFLNLATRYREVSGDQRYDELIHRVADALVRGYNEAPQGILNSYRDMWWITDNFPALAALARYDRLYHRDTSGVRKRFLESLQADYLDPRTGMFCTYVHPPSRRRMQGPRGISQMYGLHFLRDFAPDFAAQQYALAKKHLFDTVLGVAGVREFPAGAEATPDVDSGPVFFGLGLSASGFGIGAAAAMNDLDQAERLLRAATAFGLPSYARGELRYLTMPPVGQTVILFGKTLLLAAETRDAS